MQLDFIENINAFGDNVVRLYDFKSAEAMQLRDALKDSLENNKMPFDSTTLDFIEARNCQLIFRISETDEGIITEDKQLFYCDLTPQAYQEMLRLIEPFCHKDTKTYQYLYDVDSLTDLLLSPAGTW